MQAERSFHGWQWKAKRDIWGTELRQSMNFSSVSFSGGIAAFKRADHVASLIAHELSIESNNNFTDLDLPFDSLQSLTVFDEPLLERISIPPPGGQLYQLYSQHRSCPLG